jgi:outer membrane murein-binding lipoprotein Lpp
MTIKEITFKLTVLSSFNLVCVDFAVVSVCVFVCGCCEDAKITRSLTR